MRFSTSLLAVVAALAGSSSAAGCRGLPAVACEEVSSDGDAGTVFYYRTGYTDSCCGNHCKSGGMCYLPNEAVRSQFKRCANANGKRTNIYTFATYGVGKDCEPPRH
ncbi:hypothetical protein FKW77_003243 [Venturia effusa]|uniref:Uncharacterized protein n=1 Tax=Venturia effusa TaxID=50376 RepID=A0A517L8X4_9PEZI|nr:hypothetical protein FKW77_003243 [Venturia effusa]